MRPHKKIVSLKYNKLTPQKFILHKVIALMLIVCLGISIVPLNILGAPDTNTPDRTKIITEGDKKPVTGFNSQDGYYADITWDAVPRSGDWDATYYKVYIQEIDRHGNPGPFIAKLIDVTSSNAKIRDLKSGTAYNIYVTSYFKKFDGNNTYVSNESVKSNTVMIITDIEVYAYPYGNKQLRIEWDDTWLAGTRINYNLYIADDSAFAGTEPIPISSSQIGTDPRITVNPTTGRLQYIHTVKDSGRVYFIKIKPELPNIQIFYNSQSKIVAASSFILVKPTRLYDSPSGTVWKLDWSKVAVAFKDIKISYQIYKVDSKNNNLPQYMLSVDNNSTYLTVPSSDKDSYYFIRAIVTDRFGNDVYKDWNVKIESDKVYLRESEVPAIPASPELVSELILPPSTVIESYDELLTPDSATLLWNVPRKGNGDIDFDVVYDMWMITDPQKIGNPDNSDKIAENIKLSDVIVKSGTSIVGAKYKVSGLIPNSTYYFKIVAKKTYVDYVDGNVQSVTLSSVPANKMVITPPRNNGETPVAPAAPPLKVKRDSDQKDIVKDIEAMITIKNKWYEYYDASKNRWIYIEPKFENDKFVLDTGTDRTDLKDGSIVDDVYGKKFRMVEYDGGVTLDVGITEYVKGMDIKELTDIKKYPTDKVKDVQVFPNDPLENDANNPDGFRHNVDILVEDLEPNTTYVVWVRAKRAETGVISEISDPIFVTTKPTDEDKPEKPTVPTFSYGFAGDTYVDLAWIYREDYSYNIAYSTSEDVSKPIKTIKITGKEMKESKILTINELTPDTGYFFWISAENKFGDTVMTSDWSDSYYLRTKQFEPPHTPYGFGIKGTVDAITKNSITYEWMTTEGIEYILEISDNIDYKDSTIIECGKASEKKVDNLKSNRRYFARLYAYDPAKKLKSKPTQSIVAKTLKSSDDYDTDEDNENVIKGDFIVKDNYVSSDTWNIYITGVNADRFLEFVKKENKLEYIIDLSTPPSSANNTAITISYKVFREISKLSRPLTFLTQGYGVTINPYMIDTQEVREFEKDGEFNVKVILTQKVSPATNPDRMDVRLGVSRMDVKLIRGSSDFSLKAFNLPANVSYYGSDYSWYNVETMSGYFKAAQGWVKSKTDYVKNLSKVKSKISFTVNAPSDFAVAEYTMVPYVDCFNHWASEYISKIALSKSLDSVKGNMFRPDQFATNADAVKLLFDVDGYKYTSNYMTEAYKAGFINKNDAVNSQANLTKEKAMYMVAVLYEKRSGHKLVPTGAAANMFIDLNECSTELLEKVAAIAENTIFSSKDGYRLDPKASITRGEFAEILAKYLMVMGE